MCKNNLGESPAAWSKSMGKTKQRSDRKEKLRWNIFIRENLREKEE